MPTILPVTEDPPTEPLAIPLSVCLGATTEVFATIRNEKDVQEFWRGYAIGGAMCIAVLIVELVIMFLIL